MEYYTSSGQSFILYFLRKVVTEVAQELLTTQLALAVLQRDIG